MQIILEADEAHSLMTIVSSYIIDRSGVSQDGKQKVRRWRTDRSLGTPAMDRLAVTVNESLGTFIDEKTNRTIRGKRYKRAKERS